MKAVERLRSVAVYGAEARAIIVRRSTPCGEPGRATGRVVHRTAQVDGITTGTGGADCGAGPRGSAGSVRRTPNASERADGLVVELAAVANGLGLSEVGLAAPEKAPAEADRGISGRGGGQGERGTDRNEDGGTPRAMRRMITPLHGRGPSLSRDKR